MDFVRSYFLQNPYFNAPKMMRPSAIPAIPVGAVTILTLGLLNDNGTLGNRGLVAANSLRGCWDLECTKKPQPRRPQVSATAEAED